MKLMVVILNYKVPDLTIECLRSLDPDIAAIQDAKVVVVENGSQDDSEIRLSESISKNGWSAWTELVILSRNLGFTRGNNLVMRRALASADRPDYFLLLNADTVVQPGAVCELLRFMDEHPQVGIAGSRLISAEGEPQGSPFRFLGIASEFDRALNIGLVSKLLSRWSVCWPKTPSPCQVDWVAGAAMLVRRKVIEKIGLLDEGYFAYFEDVDYCLNARRAGWPTWYVPNSVIVHYEGSSSGIRERMQQRRPRYWYEARRRFFLKNYGVVYAATADLAFLVGSLLARLRRLIETKPDLDPPHFLADSIRYSVFRSGFKLEDTKA